MNNIKHLVMTGKLNQEEHKYLLMITILRNE